MGKQEQHKKERVCEVHLHHDTKMAGVIQDSQKHNKHLLWELKDVLKKKK